VRLHAQLSKACAALFALFGSTSRYCEQGNDIADLEAGRWRDIRANFDNTTTALMTKRELILKPVGLVLVGEKIMIRSAHTRCDELDK
jgi:hypothetical protein